MRKHYNIYKVVMVMLLGIAAASCSDTDDIVSPSSPEAENNDIVLFSAGSEMVQGTRAATVLNMPNKVRFAASMYYQKVADKFYPTPWLAYLQVDNEGLGNSNYRKGTFENPGTGKADTYNNDIESNIFYWQNRQPHIFIGYIDNYNAAYTFAKNGAPAYIPDALDHCDRFNIIENKELVRKQMCKHFDLRNPKDGDGHKWTKMADQYDPLIACTEKQPGAADAETNRVYLTFKHQLSQIQVNLKGGESADLSADQIDAVELLGISESADVFPFVDYKVDNANMEEDELETAPIPEDAQIEKYDDSYIRPAEAGIVDITKYTDEQIEHNPYGTSFDMFQAEEPSLGYLKRFEAIAYGHLSALRIHWHEMTTEKNEVGEETIDEEGNPIMVPGVEHTVTFAITDANFSELKSGKRYVYNLEIRRGTLAAIQAIIDDWQPYETVYYEEGTIEN